MGSHLYIAPWRCVGCVMPPKAWKTTCTWASQMALILLCGGRRYVSQTHGKSSQTIRNLSVSAFQWSLLTYSIAGTLEYYVICWDRPWESSWPNCLCLPHPPCLSDLRWQQRAWWPLHVSTATLWDLKSWPKGKWVGKQIATLSWLAVAMMRLLWHHGWKIYCSQSTCTKKSKLYCGVGTGP